MIGTRTEAHRCPQGGRIEKLLKELGTVTGTEYLYALVHHLTVIFNPLRSHITPRLKEALAEKILEVSQDQRQRRVDAHLGVEQERKRLGTMFLQ